MGISGPCKVSSFAIWVASNGQHACFAKTEPLFGHLKAFDLEPVAIQQKGLPMEPNSKDWPI